MFSHPDMGNLQFLRLRGGRSGANPRLMEVWTFFRFLSVAENVEEKKKKKDLTGLPAWRISLTELLSSIYLREAMQPFADACWYLSLQGQPKHRQGYSPHPPSNT